MKKYLLGLISGIILTSGIVFASTIYNASQIKYTKSNNTEVTLDEALTELYTSADTTIADKDTQITSLQNTLNSYKTFTFNLRSSASGTGTGNGEFKFNNDLKNKYKYFKVTEGVANTYVKDFTLRARNSSGTNLNISFDTKYNTSDYNAVWVNVSSNTSSNTSNTAQKTITVELYN